MARSATGFMSRFGPGLLVTAAFIGPGTIATASSVGAQHGFGLVVALLFSVLACIALQEMAARLGLVARQGLSSVLVELSPRRPQRLVIGTLIVLAIDVGNAAYQGGNLAGAALGASLAFGAPTQLWVALISTVAFALLISGRYRIVERALVVLVMVMSAVFVTTMVLVLPRIDLASMPCRSLGPDPVARAAQARQR